MRLFTGLVLALASLFLVFSSTIVHAADVNKITIPGPVMVPDNYSGVTYNTVGVVTTGTSRNYRSLINAVESEDYNYIEVAGNTSSNAGSITAYLRLLRNGATTQLGSAMLPKATTGKVRVSFPAYTPVSGDALFLVVVVQAYNSTSTACVLYSVTVGYQE